MEQDLYAALSANVGLTAMIGGNLTWMERPQASGLPAVVLQVASSARDYTMQRRETLERPLVQIDCWAGSYDAAKLTARAVIVALDTLTVAPFMGAFVESERDAWEAGDGPQADGSTNFFRVSLDVRVAYRAAG